MGAERELAKSSLGGVKRVTVGAAKADCTSNAPKKAVAIGLHGFKNFIAVSIPKK